MTEMPRGATPRRTRPRRVREQRRRFIDRVLREHRRRVQTFTRMARKRMTRRFYAFFHAIVHAIENVIVPSVPAYAPLQYTRCETSKIRLRVFNAVKARDKPVYIVTMETRSVVARITRLVYRGYGYVQRIVVTTRIAVAAIRDWLSMTIRALLHLLAVEERKPLNSDALEVYKLVDAFQTMRQQTRYRATIAEAVVDDASILREIYAERGCIERYLYATVRCSPAYLADWSAVMQESFAYWRRKIVDRIVRNLLKKHRDKWYRMFDAQWLKDAFMSCDAETVDAWDACILYWLRKAERMFAETGYGEAYRRVASR